jgi:nitrogen fixation protein FixH
MQKEFTGRHMLAILVSFFGVIIAVNVLLAVLANTTWSGLVVANSYVESQAFNAKNKARLAEESLGLTPQYAYKAGTFEVTIVELPSATTHADRVEVTLGRPVDEREDQKLTLRALSSTTFSAPAKLGSGLWSGEIVVNLKNGQLLHQPIRFAVKD